MTTSARHQHDADLRARARTALRDVFGFSDYRPAQERIVGHLLDGGDAFVLMPTGGGKSLCYQLPSLVRPGTGMVVSPLISLMKDQVDALTAAGVSAAAFNSSLPPDQARMVLSRLADGALDLLYVAPETLMTEAFLDRLHHLVANGAGLSLIAIDEAHCVSQWGHDFRPEYVRLGELGRLFPDTPVIACTATADPQTREDVRMRLGLLQAPCFITGFDRPNIRYTVVEKREPLQQLKRFLQGHGSEAGIIYCLSRKRTEDVAGKLSAAGIPAAAYHAGLPAEDRRRVQDAFARDDILVIVATVAFGMGIDKSNVRFVVHYDLPKSVESYYQETGRAGRDGLPAEALLLFGLGDAPVVRSLIERSGNDGSAGRDHEQVRVELHKLESMIAYADALSCRRQALLGYFGEGLDQACGNCDICLDPPETYDATEEARMALSCVYRVGQSFGAGHVADVLSGVLTDKVVARGHERLSTFGIGSHLTRDHWMGLLRQLVHIGYLSQDLARYSVLGLSTKARPLLRGEATLELARPRTRVPAKRGRHARTQAGPPVLSAEEQALFAELRDLRKRLAESAGVPAYVVFSDATLAEMAALKPRTPEALLGINGVGQTKLERYGDVFLAVTRMDSPSTSK